MAGKSKLKCVGDPGIIELSEGLRVLSDPNRLRIMCFLLKGESCVCEVGEELGISQQLTSHHLNVLRESGFLAVRKEGTSSYYSVDEDKLARIKEVFSTYLDPGKQDVGVEETACCGPGAVPTSSPRRKRRRKG